MKKPEITLKNVKMFQGHDGVGLNAWVYVDGVKTFFIFDGATGGESEHTVINKEKYLLLRKYADSIPLRELKINGEVYNDKEGKPMMMKTTIDELVDNIIKDIQEQKLAKSIERKMETCIIVGDRSIKDRYSVYSFKKPLSQIPAASLEASIIRIKKELKPGETIWNTNIKID